MTARRVFLLAFVGFFLAAGAWAIALPVNGTYDESRHIVRAYAVVDGQWLPGGADRMSFDVPPGLLPTNPDCTWSPRPRSRPASCQVAAPAGPDRISVDTYVARYNPVYYLPVGLPLKLWPDTTGVLLARLVSALLNALLLAAAAGIAAALGNRLLVAATALVATPMVVNLAGSVNPNGLEISAAVLLFTAGLALVARPGFPDARPGSTDPAGLPRRPLLACAGVAAFTLLTLRHVGPVLVAVILLAVAVLAGRSGVRAQARRRDTWSVLGGSIAAGLLVAGGWVVAARSPVGASLGRGLDLSTWGVLKGVFQERFEFYLRQIVGQFGYGETTISPYAIVFWYALLVVVVGPALWRGAWRPRLVIVGLVVVGFAMLIGFEFLFVREHGWFSHGRYALPILVGAVLIAAWSRTVAPWVPIALIAATAPVHLYALVRVMSRFQVGIESSLDPFGGSWHPPLGSLLPLVTLVLGVGFLIASVWSRREPTHSGEDGSHRAPSTRTVPGN